MLVQPRTIAFEFHWHVCPMRVFYSKFSIEVFNWSHLRNNTSIKKTSCSQWYKHTGTIKQTDSFAFMYFIMGNNDLSDKTLNTLSAAQWDKCDCWLDILYATLKDTDSRARKVSAYAVFLHSSGFYTGLADSLSRKRVLEIRDVPCGFWHHSSTNRNKNFAEAQPF